MTFRSEPVRSLSALPLLQLFCPVFHHLIQPTRHQWFPTTQAPHTGTFLTQLARQSAVLAQVASTQGSAPREAGTWMAVFADALVGTIGGGHLEYQAIAHARAQLQGAAERSAGPPQASSAPSGGRELHAVSERGGRRTQRRAAPSKFSSRGAGACGSEPA
ncbi:MAG: XdhC family protein [Polaromonas sp.]